MSEKEIKDRSLKDILEDLHSESFLALLFHKESTCYNDMVPVIPGKRVPKKGKSSLKTQFENVADDKYI